jgi:hypothetical protein
MEGGAASGGQGRTTKYTKDKKGQAGGNQPRQNFVHRPGAKIIEIRTSGVAGTKEENHESNESNE